MADVQPLRALHYDLGRVGSARRRRLAAVRRHRPCAARRARRALALQRRPRRPPRDARRRRPLRPRRRAALPVAGRRRARARRRAGDLGDRPGLRQGRTAARAPAQGLFARVRVEEYGAGRIRPHERTHPGPREDRLRLTRATKANLSPIFSLYSDPTGTAWGAVAPATEERAVRRADRRRGHAPPPVARRRPRRDRDRAGRARGHRAADRRRPPPLRDRARLRRRGRRRGRAPLRAHVPRRARGPRPEGLPHAPAGQRHDAGDPGGARDGAAPGLRRRPRSTTPPCARPTATARSPWATSTASSSAPSG